MNKFVSSLLVFFVLFGFCPLNAQEASPETAAAADTEESSALRAWTSTAGDTVKAEFVKSEYGRVYLKKEDGKLVNIPVANLCADDQAYIKELTDEGTRGPPRLGGDEAFGTVLTDKEIADLVSEWSDDEADRRIVFSASMERLSLDPFKQEKDIRKYAKTGRIPIRFTATLYEYRGKKAALMRGKCHFYIMDEAGTVIDRKTMQIAALCPT